MSQQYRHKIETIEVSDRIRAMQGKEETPSSIKSRYDDSQRYREEKEKLVRKYIHNPESYTVTKKEEESSSTSPWYIALAVIFLLVAFGAGISFGMSSIGVDGDVADMLSGHDAKINDTAFPEVKVNKSLSYNYTKSYSNTTSTSSDDSSSSSSSSDSSSSSSSSSSSPSGGRSGGGSSRGGSSSGGRSGGGSSGGGSSSGGSSGGGSSGGGSSSGGSSGGGSSGGGSSGSSDE